MAIRMMTTCGNCGQRCHIAGCVSKKCRLDGLRRQLKQYQESIAFLQLAIKNVESEEDDGSMLGESKSNESRTERD